MKLRVLAEIFKKREKAWQRTDPGKPLVTWDIKNSHQGPTHSQLLTSEAGTPIVELNEVLVNFVKVM